MSGQTEVRTYIWMCLCLCDALFFLFPHVSSASVSFLLKHTSKMSLRPRWQHKSWLCPVRQDWNAPKAVDTDHTPHLVRGFAIVFCICYYLTHGLIKVNKANAYTVKHPLVLHTSPHTHTPTWNMPPACHVVRWYMPASNKGGDTVQDLCFVVLKTDLFRHTL